MTECLRETIENTRLNTYNRSKAIQTSEAVMENKLDLSEYGIRQIWRLKQRKLPLNIKVWIEEVDVSRIEGVIIKEKEVDDMKVSLVEVTAEGEKEIGKKQGSYLTIEVQGIRQQDTETQQRVEKVFANELAYFLKRNKITKESSCLVVGLGNWNVTPDALGLQSWRTLWSQDICLNCSRIRSRKAIGRSVRFPQG